MHQIDGPSSQALRPAADPLRFAPPPGRWTLWHGQQAEAVIRLAQSEGRPATAEERDAAPALPAGMPALLQANGAAWMLAVEGQTFLVQKDENGNYVSAYLARLT